MEKYMRSRFGLLVGILILLGGMFLGWRLFFQHEYVLTDALKKDRVVSVLIIGSGPAGLSAAVYASRGGFYTMVLEGKNPGGQLMGTSFVENWPGMQKKRGSELIDGLREQAKEFGAVMVAQTVKTVDWNQWPFKVTIVDNADTETELSALAVIIATGSSPSLLEIPGEQEYWGKGVTTCAICDAPLYKDKEVFVVGGGDSAAEEAMQLAPYARKITLLVRRGQADMKASKAMQDRLKAYSHISTRFYTALKEIKGDGKHVTSVDLLEKGEQKTEPIGGIFEAIGHIPNTDLFTPYLKMDENKYIKVKGQSQKTSLKGIFAAGDVVDVDYRQAGIAAGDGIRAALDASAFLREIGYNEAFAEELIPHLFMQEGGLGREALQEIKSTKEYQALSKDTQEPLFIDFFTEYCVVCEQMLPFLEMLATELKGQVKFIKANIMNVQDLAEQFEITTAPTFIIIKNGQLLARAQERMEPKELRSFVQEVLKAKKESVAEDKSSEEK